MTLSDPSFQYTLPGSAFSLNLTKIFTGFSGLTNNLHEFFFLFSADRLFLVSYPENTVEILPTGSFWNSLSRSRNKGLEDVERSGINGNDVLQENGSFRCNKTILVGY